MHSKWGRLTSLDMWKECAWPHLIYCILRACSQRQGHLHCSVCSKLVDGEHQACRLCGHGGHSTHVQVGVLSRARAMPGSMQIICDVA